MAPNSIAQFTYIDGNGIPENPSGAQVSYLFSEFCYLHTTGFPFSLIYYLLINTRQSLTLLCQPDKEFAFYLLNPGELLTSLFIYGMIRSIVQRFRVRIRIPNKPAQWHKFTNIDRTF